MKLNPDERSSIVVVDDESYICNIIVEAISIFDDYLAVSFTDPQKAIDHIRLNRVDLVLSDLVMGDFSGEDVLDAAKKHHDDCVVILMTAHPTVNNAISMLKKGAYDYLVKPFKLEMLKSTIARGLKQQKLARENLHLREQIGLYKLSEATGIETSLDTVLDIAAETAMTVMGVQAVSVLLRQGVSSAPVPVLVRGASRDSDTVRFLNGSHELCARALQQLEPHSESALVEGERRLIRSIASHPLLSRGEGIGLFNIVQEDPYMPLKPGQMNLLSIVASKIAAAVENNNLYEKLQSSYLTAIKALANAIEARDQYTRGHTERVTVLADLIAARLGWSRKQRKDLKTGCTLHDIGKIGVPDTILNKPGGLSGEEVAIMQKHPLLGAKMLEDVEHFTGAIPYVLYHHEKYDGTGYPQGLVGEEIPIEGRLLAVVDTFDAIVSDRPYRPGRSAADAIDELCRFKGSQFDPVIVDMLVEVWKAGQIDGAAIYPTKNMRPVSA